MSLNFKYCVLMLWQVLIGNECLFGRPTLNCKIGIKWCCYVQQYKNIWYYAYLLALTAHTHTHIEREKIGEERHKRRDCTFSYYCCILVYLAFMRIYYNTNTCSSVNNIHTTKEISSGFCCGEQQQQ